MDFVNIILAGMIVFATIFAFDVFVTVFYEQTANFSSMTDKERSLMVLSIET